MTRRTGGRATNTPPARYFTLVDQIADKSQNTKSYQGFFASGVFQTLTEPYVPLSILYQLRSNESGAS